MLDEIEFGNHSEPVKTACEHSERDRRRELENNFHEIFFAKRQQRKKQQTNRNDNNRRQMRKHEQTERERQTANVRKFSLAANSRREQKTKRNQRRRCKFGEQSRSVKLIEMIRHENINERAEKRGVFGKEFTRQFIRADAADEEQKSEIQISRVEPIARQKAKKRERKIRQRRIKSDADIAETVIRIVCPTRKDFAA